MAGRGMTRSSFWEAKMAEIPQWHVAGDWFDVCSCDIACPCIFGQPPTNNVCQGVLAYRIREGHFGDVTLADLKLVLVATFQGNLWASQATGFKLGLFVDSRRPPTTGGAANGV